MSTLPRITHDLQKLYRALFGSTPEVPEKEEDIYKVDGQKLSDKGSALATEYKGKEIWLPVKFFELDTSTNKTKSEVFLPYSVVKISARKTIVKTPLMERRGSIKEQYNIDDYQISLKGFVIGYDKSGKYPIWPEEEITILRNLFETNEAIKLDNALTNLFLGADSRVIIESLDLPEVEGGRKNYQPFSMQLESDNIFTLEL
jgi:hypothetical protein